MDDGVDVVLDDQAFQPVTLVERQQQLDVA